MKPRLGKNMKDALKRVTNHHGWVTYDKRCRATVAAIVRLEKLGLVDVCEWPQFRASLAYLKSIGHVSTCPGCGKDSAYADGDAECHEIKQIGNAGMDTWECLHCRVHWVREDSPINHPAYTHSED